MEWKRVKNWLLVMLAVADLILAVHVGRQLLQQQRTLRAATENAVLVAQKRGIRLEAEAIFRLPEESQAFRTERSGVMEYSVAEKLLGEAEASEPGGGVGIYVSPQGEVSFRRGGALEFRLKGRQNAEPVALLEEAGLPMDGVRLMIDGEETTLFQQKGKLPVFNCQLICRNEGEGYSVRGRWLLGTEQEADETGLHRAQLVLALCDLLEGQGIDRVAGLEAGFYLQSEDARAMRLIPVWAADTTQGRLYLNCLTGEQLVF